MTLGTRSELGLFLSKHATRMFPTCNTMNCVVHQFFTDKDPTFFGTVNSDRVRRMDRIMKAETDKCGHTRTFESFEPVFFNSAPWLTRYIDSLDTMSIGQPISGADALFLLTAQSLDEQEYFAKREAKPLRSRDGQCKARPAYLKVVSTRS